MNININLRFILNFSLQIKLITNFIIPATPTERIAKDFQNGQLSKNLL